MTVPHFLDIAQAQAEYGIDRIVQRALDMKHCRYRGHELRDKVVGLLFEKPSLRTRVSFEVGVQHLGGSALQLKQDEIGLGQRESVADTARVLSRYVDMVMIRTFSHDTLTAFADAATIPVINGLTDASHPCQAIADALTIYDCFKRFKGLTCAYFGDDNNVSVSLGKVCHELGITFILSVPEQKNSYPSSIHLEPNPTIAAKHADILYTDTWVSMGAAQSQDALSQLAPYQLNQALLRQAPATAIVLHCLPAHRGDEITSAVIDGNQSRVFDQAENRLHAQKAIMALLAG